jgi:hypothetical protein
MSLGFSLRYARDALATLEEKDATALAPLRTALETALGIKFEGKKGDHFFRSTLIQTLFYGVFSAWVVFVSLLKRKSVLSCLASAEGPFTCRV